MLLQTSRLIMGVCQVNEALNVSEQSNLGIAPTFIRDRLYLEHLKQAQGLL
jgi:hypothetical protein